MTRENGVYIEVLKHYPLSGPRLSGGTRIAVLKCEHAVLLSAGNAPPRRAHCELCTREEKKKAKEERKLKPGLRGRMVEINGKRVAYKSPEFMREVAKHSARTKPGHVMPGDATASALNSVASALAALTRKLEAQEDRLNQLEDVRTAPMANGVDTHAEDEDEDATEETHS